VSCKKKALRKKEKIPQQPTKNYLIKGDTDGLGEWDAPFTNRKRANRKRPKGEPMTNKPVMTSSATKKNDRTQKILGGFQTEGPTCSFLDKGGPDRNVTFEGRRNGGLARDKKKPNAKRGGTSQRGKPTEKKNGQNDREPKDYPASKRGRKSIQGKKGPDTRNITGKKKKIVCRRTNRHFEV